MPYLSRVILATVCLVGMASGFEQLAGFKIPSLQGMRKAAENKAKFGDKKLVVITGTSSGGCPRACVWVVYIAPRLEPCIVPRAHVQCSDWPYPCTHRPRARHGKGDAKNR